MTLIHLGPVCEEGCCVATVDPTLRVQQLCASNEVRPMFELLDDDAAEWSGARWHPGLLEDAEPEPEPAGWAPPAWVVELIGATATAAPVALLAWERPRPDEPATWRVIDWRHPSPHAVLTNVTDDR